MPVLHGEIVQFGMNESFVHAVDSQVVVSHRGRAIAAGIVGPDDTFEIELPGGLRGEIEVTVGTRGVAPAIVDIDDDVEGGDLGVTMIYSPGGAYY